MIDPFLKNGRDCPQKRFDFTSRVWGWFKIISLSPMAVFLLLKFEDLVSTSRMRNTVLETVM